MGTERFEKELGLIHKVVIGDLFRSGAQTLVNPVNCVGIMGKGVALEFKKRFPRMFADYVARSGRREVRLGRPYLYKAIDHELIINFPTKDHWRSISKLQDIEEGLRYLLTHYGAWGIKSLAVPALGCGAGKLRWEAVGPMLYKFLSQMDIPVALYAPFDTPRIMKGDVN